jgi:hypothetical protein
MDCRQQSLDPAGCGDADDGRLAVVAALRVFVIARTASNDGRDATAAGVSGGGSSSSGLKPTFSAAAPSLSSDGMKRLCDRLMQTLQPLTDELVEAIPLLLPVNTLEHQCFVSQASAVMHLQLLRALCPPLTASQCCAEISGVRSVLLFVDDGQQAAHHIPASVSLPIEEHNLQHHHRHVIITAANAIITCPALIASALGTIRCRPTCISHTLYTCFSQSAAVFSHWHLFRLTTA